MNDLSVKSSKTNFKEHFSLESLNTSSFVISGTFDSTGDLEYQAASATVWVHFRVDVLINCRGD